MQNLASSRWGKKRSCTSISSGAMESGPNPAAALAATAAISTLCFPRCDHRMTRKHLLNSASVLQKHGAGQTHIECSSCWCYCKASSKSYSFQSLDCGVIKLKVGCFALPNWTISTSSSWLTAPRHLSNMTYGRGIQHKNIVHLGPCLSPLRLVTLGPREYE